MRTAVHVNAVSAIDELLPSRKGSQRCGARQMSRKFWRTQKRAVPPHSYGLDHCLTHKAERSATFALKHRLPTLSPNNFNISHEGCLIGYGPDANDLFRHAAIYVHRILKGAKTSQLPVEQPAKYELVINLKTAKVLGLAIPPSLLLRADQVIG